MEPRTEGTGETVSEVKQVIDQKLEDVEVRVDAAAEGAKKAVHQLRAESEQAVGRLLQDLARGWRRVERNLEAQLAQRPWTVLGGMVLIAFVLSRWQRSRTRGNRTMTRPR